MTTAPVLSITSSNTDGIRFSITNPFLVNGVSPSQGVQVYLYVDTDATKIPPTATPSAPTLGMVDNASAPSLILYRTGTAGTVYSVVATMTNMATNEVVTSNVVTTDAFPTVATTIAPLVTNTPAIAVVLNNGTIAITTADGNPMWVSGGAGVMSTGNPWPTQWKVRRSVNYDQFGNNYSQLGMVSNFPFIDTTVQPGVKYYYNISTQDAATNSADVDEVGGANLKTTYTVPAVMGATSPDAPSVQVFPVPTNNTLMVLITPGTSTNGAPITEYDIGADPWTGQTFNHTVKASDGPWYVLSSSKDTPTLTEGTTVYVAARARSIGGTSDWGAPGYNVTTAKGASDMAITGMYDIVQVGEQLPRIGWTFAGGTPPFTVNAYYSDGDVHTTITSKTAQKTFKNAFPLTFQAPTSMNGGTLLVTVKDSTGLSYSATPYVYNDPGTFKPGDMSDYIDTWVDNQDVIFLDKPKTIRQIFITGTLPPDTVTTTKIHLTMVEGRTTLFDVAAKLTIQGQTSVGVANKGYKVKLSNKDTNDDQYIKFGDAPPLKTFDIKSFGYTDNTMVREPLSARIAKRMDATCSAYGIGDFRAPYSEIGGIGTDLFYFGETLGEMDGFWVEAYFNGAYMGMYYWRTTVVPELYQMDDSNANHILLKYDHSGGTGNGQTVNLFDFTAAFVGANWDMKSPDIAAYKTQDQLQTVAPDIYNAANALTSAFAAYSANTSDATALSTLEGLLSVPAQIDYYLFSITVNNIDGVNDNFMLLSWNGGKTWMFRAYDLDQTLGDNNQNVAQDPTDILAWNGIPYGALCMGPWAAQTKARYAYLRNTGVFSITSLISDMRDLTASSGRLARSRMYAQYGTAGGAAQGTLSYIINWYQARLAYLDNYFGYTPNTVPVWS